MSYEQRELNRLVHNVPDNLREIEKIYDDTRILRIRLTEWDCPLSWEERTTLADAFHKINAVACVHREILESKGVGDKKKKIFMIDHLKFWK